jgi:outer membrane protein
MKLMKKTTLLRTAHAALLLSACATLPSCCMLAQAQVTLNTAPQPGIPVRLTVADAERIALQNNPRMSIARLVALAQAQVTREVRSRELPTATGSLTAVDAHSGTRITAGMLNNPSVYERAAGGVSVSQLITDFGRTRHLIRSAESQSMAQKDAELATRADMILAVDQAFYQALSSQAVLEVAKGTVKARQATADQIGALTASKLRSGLDQSFANVELSQAKLLMLDAQDAVEDSMEKLNALLGSEDGGAYTLVDETPKEAQLAPAEIEPLVRLAFTSRPDLSALNESYTAAVQLSAAEHDLKRPTVSALAAAGGTPVRADQITSSWYGAVGANVSIPIFNGFLYTARAREADLRAEAAKEEVRNLRELIARDVRTSALAAQAAYQRIGVASQLLDQSNMALDLAQTRYQLGLSGIVELSQAQLAQTQGQIAFANARFAFQQALAVLRFQTGQ